MEYIVYLYMNTFYIMKFIQKGVHTLYTIFLFLKFLKVFTSRKLANGKWYLLKHLNRKNFIKVFMFSK